MFLGIVNTTGSGLVATMLGMPGLFWMYPTFLSNYFLVDRRTAVILMLAALVTLSIHGKAFGSTLEHVLFVVTS